MKIRENSFMGILVKIVWVLNFMGVLNVPKFVLAGFLTWGGMFICLIFTTRLIEKYVR